MKRRRLGASPRAPKGERKAPKRRRPNITLGRCTNCKATRRFNITYSVGRNKAKCLTCGRTKVYRALPVERRTLIHFDDGWGITLCGLHNENVAVAARKSLITCERCRKGMTQGAA